MDALQDPLSNDPAARNRTLAAESIKRIEVAMANGKCDDEPDYWREQMHIMKLWRDV
jgi:hypothetical protein